MNNLTDQFWAQHYPGGDLNSVGSDYAPVRREIGNLVYLITIQPEEEFSTPPESDR